MPVEISHSLNGVFFNKIAQCRPLFVNFCISHSYPVQNITVNMFLQNFCRRLYSNRESLVSNATTLPTESQPLPILLTPPSLCLAEHFTNTQYRSKYQNKQLECKQYLSQTFKSINEFEIKVRWGR